MTLTSSKLKEEAKKIDSFEIQSFVEKNELLIKSLIVIQNMDKRNENTDDWECALAPQIFI